jgi:hypothetical protein
MYDVSPVKLSKALILRVKTLVKVGRSLLGHL